jgi:hypothetical protein
MERAERLQPQGRTGSGPVERERAEWRLVRSGRPHQVRKPVRPADTVQVKDMPRGAARTPRMARKPFRDNAYRRPAAGTAGRPRPGGETGGFSFFARRNLPL